MILQYPYASRQIELTGGLINKIEDMINTAVENWREKQRTYNELSKLSSRELNDIGLTRGDIPFVAKGTSGLRR